MTGEEVQRIRVRALGLGTRIGHFLEFSCCMKNLCTFGYTYIYIYTYTHPLLNPKHYYDQHV